VRTFDSATAEVIAEQHPLSKRSVLYVLAAMIAVFIAFISFSHLDRVVTAKGRLVPVAGALTVQPLDKAIITSILVAVGDTVKKGQVLAKMDPTFVRADLTEVKEKVASLTSQKRRIEAEEAGRAFHMDQSRPSDVLQDAIFRKRATEFQSGILDFDQKISSAQAEVIGLRQSLDDYQSRFKIAQEAEEINAKLAKDGVISHLAMITIQDQRIELGRKLGEIKNKLASEDHILESIREERKVFIDKWHDDNLTNLVDVNAELEEAQSELTKTVKHNDLTDLVAPMDAIVLEVPKLSTGGVAIDAQPLFSLIPLDAPVEAAVEIDTKDSGFVKVGDPVKIKFDTYKYLEHGTGEGVVKTISQDSFTQSPGQDAVSPERSAGQERAPYFEARVRITALNLHDVPKPVRLVPGMTLVADVIVGRRTIMWYLLGGALRSGSEAMREP
jgi:HlyD family type I secretion membrane fusion protein